MRYVALAVLGLGYTRVNGILSYDIQTRSFPELTPAQARKLIDSNELVGVKFTGSGLDGEFIPDKEYGFENLLLKTGCGKFRPYYNDIPGEPVNSIYAVVRVIDTDYRGRLYEVVGNTCQRIKISEEQLRGLAAITQVALVTINDDSINVMECVPYEDRRKTVDVKPVAAQDNSHVENESTEVKENKTGSKSTKTSSTKRKQSTHKK